MNAAQIQRAYLRHHALTRKKPGGKRRMCATLVASALTLSVGHFMLGFALPEVSATPEVQQSTQFIAEVARFAATLTDVIMQAA